MKVYVVFGTSGEYSDRNTWKIAAYFDEELAKQHVLLAEERARVIYSLLNAHFKLANTEGRALTPEECKKSEELSRSNPFDPEDQDWLDRNSYYYENVEIFNELYLK